MLDAAITERINYMELNTVVCKDGGILKELYKSEGFGQVSMRIIHPGKSSGGSLHREKDERWWIAMGSALIRLEFPDGTMRAKFYVDGPASRIIEVPAGTGHEISNCGSEDVVLLWHSSKAYDSENPDSYAWNW